MKTTGHIGEDRVDRELTGSDARAAVHEEAVIPVIQEELDVRTRRVEKDSGVRVNKKIEAREEIIDEPLTKEDVDIERVSIDRAVDAPVAVRYEGDTMIIPVLEEVLVVEKRLMLKEEIRVTRRRTQFRAPERVTVRREVASVERIEDSDSARLSEHGASLEAREIGSESLLDQKRRQQEELKRAVSPPSRRDE